MSFIIRLQARSKMDAILVLRAALKMLGRVYRGRHYPGVSVSSQQGMAG
jgi:hypothetical protein